MIKHYFCEYCGKDFLSEEECMTHEISCQVKIEQEKKKEEDKKKELEALIFDFKALVKGVADYIKKYGAQDQERAFNEIFSKMNQANKEIKERISNIGSFSPVSYEFTLSDPKFNYKDLSEILGTPKITPKDFKDTDDAEDCDKLSHMIHEPSSKEESSESEIDDIIDKLSKPSLSINPDSRRNYIYNGQTVSTDELLEALDELSKKSHFYF